MKTAGETNKPMTNNNTDNNPDAAGQTQSIDPKLEKEKSDQQKRELKFYEHCPAAEAYIRKADRGRPPRPAQHSLAMRWPKFDCVDELEKEHWEFGGPAVLPGLLLHGSSGTGKTTSAYLAIHRSLKCWRSFNTKVPDVVGWRAVELGRCISDLSRSGGEEMQDFLTELAQAELLFIDDLDKARFTPRVESELFDLLEFRESADKPVVVTTNLKGRELEKMFSRHIGPAIVNRLRRMCVPIDFDAAKFDEGAALAAIQEKIRRDYVPEAEARRVFYLGQEAG